MDLIERQDAIDALERSKKIYFDRQVIIGVMQDIVRNLPSAQPETHDKRTETHACDLIDRQMAIDGFYEMASDMDYLCTVSDYVSFLESLPSAQPERKKGRWKVTPVYIKCSECGESFMLIPQNYCPHCGAKMEGEQDG